MPPPSRGAWVSGEKLPPGRTSSSRKTEEDSFADLVLRMARSPTGILQSFYDATLNLTGAESAVVSVLDENGPRPEFRWLATSGRIAQHLGVTLPRDQSPCGVVLQQNATLLVVDPALTFRGSTNSVRLSAKYSSRHFSTKACPSAPLGGQSCTRQTFRPGRCPAARNGCTVRVGRSGGSRSL